MPKKGLLKGGTIIEATSEIRNWTSNGSGSKGYTLILVMPESMSIERRRLMSLYGAEFV
jgi:cysteine synthase A